MDVGVKGHNKNSDNYNSAYYISIILIYVIHFILQRISTGIIDFT